jgi:hypothetical protein
MQTAMGHCRRGRSVVVITKLANHSAPDNRRQIQEKNEGTWRKRLCRKAGCQRDTAFFAQYAYLLVPTQILAA